MKTFVSLEWPLVVYTWLFLVDLAVVRIFLTTVYSFPHQNLTLYHYITFCFVIPVDSIKPACRKKKSQKNTSYTSIDQVAYKIFYFLK